MSLYKQWVREAYNQEGSSIKEVWDIYIPKEQKIYEDILKNKITNIKGKVEEIAKKYNMSDKFICGFIDGINDASLNPISIEDLKEDSEISIDIDFKKLFKKMVEYRAEHLINLPQWDNIFSKEEREEMYKEQRNIRTVVKNKKIGRNDLCICGSGKKYKKCCGVK